MCSCTPFCQTRNWTTKDEDLLETLVREFVIGRVCPFLEESFRDEYDLKSYEYDLDAFLQLRGLQPQQSSNTRWGSQTCSRLPPMRRNTSSGNCAMPWRNNKLLPRTRTMNTPGVDYVNSRLRTKSIFLRM